MRNPVKVVRENYQMAKEALIEIYEEDKTYYAFCAGSIATSVASIVIIHVLESKGYGSKYNPAQPIPGLLLSEQELKSFVASGLATVEFLNERDLGQEFLKYRDEMIEVAMNQ